MAALPIQLSLDDMKTIAEMVADFIGRPKKARNVAWMHAPQIGCRVMVGNPEHIIDLTAAKCFCRGVHKRAEAVAEAAGIRDGQLVPGPPPP